MNVYIKTIKVDGYEYDVIGYCEYYTAPFMPEYYEVRDGQGFRITDEVFFTEPTEEQIREYVESGIW